MPVSLLDSSRVCIDLHPGERLIFPGTGIEVEVVAKSGRNARLSVVLPRSTELRKSAGPHELALPLKRQAAYR